jgi:hypothetical protein
MNGTQRASRRLCIPSLTLILVLQADTAWARCRTGEQCPEGSYCEKPVGACDAEGRCEVRPEACIAVFDPVCGCDAVTYGNACEAARAGGAVAARGACDDRDLDGVPDADDCCPDWPNPEQADTNEDGVGDACECGDANGDGIVNVADVLAINEAIYAGPPFPPLCDANFDAGCDIDDVLSVNKKIFGEPAYCRQFPPRLRYFQTCGSPVCGVFDPPEGIPPCTTQEQGAFCRKRGELCFLPDDPCNTKLLCTDQDPTLGGCPISRAENKRDIEYVDAESRRSIHEQVMDMRLARYAYAGALDDGRTHLGFIIDDDPSSPAVRPGAERVDLYGFTSMAVIALQEQAARLESLDARIGELERELGQAALQLERCEAAPDPREE